MDEQFDILAWYHSFQSCVRYFLTTAQWDCSVRALAAYLNIQLPFQRTLTHNQPQNYSLLYPRTSSPSPVTPPPGVPHPVTAAHAQQFPLTSILPYIRRLVATGWDYPAILHGFFGDDWERGVKPLQEHERRNYLFAAKSASWLEVKQAYDMGVDETVPFLKPLRQATEEEIRAAEEGWSEWLAMQDW